jgi:hypothetical protein
MVVVVVMVVVVTAAAAVVKETEHYGQCSFMFWSSQVQIFAWRPAILTKVLCGFS